MPDTDTALGSGVRFQSMWDVETAAGSVDTVSGVEKLGSDLAFALQRAVRESDTKVRGRRFDPDLREDIRILVRRVAAAESRIDSVRDITVTESDDAGRTAEVAMSVVAVTDERGEFVFAV